MSISYQAKSELVLNQQLKVQSLHLPFVITGNATPALVVVGRDNPGILAIRTEGVDQITGALASGDTAPTYAAPVDANGVLNILVSIGERIAKVVSAKVVRRNGVECIASTLPSAPASGVIAGTNNDKICLNLDSAASFAAGSYDACLEVSYIVEE